MQSSRAFNGGKLGELTRAGNWRIYVLALVVIGGAGIIFLRLFFVQVGAYETYRLMAENQHDFFQKLIPERGQIYLNNGSDSYPVAVNRRLQMAFAVPKEIENQEEVSRRVAEIH